MKILENISSLRFVKSRSPDVQALVKHFRRQMFFTSYLLSLVPEQKSKKNCYFSNVMLL
jgi:hypothetical protein